MERFPRRRKRRWPLVTVIIAALLGGYSYYTLTRPLTLVSPVQSVNQLSAPAKPSKLAWPAKSPAAVGIVGSSVLETHGSENQIPTASTAKTVTVLTVLDKYPLKKGEKGPEITLTEADVALYNAYVAQNGSRVRVQAGEKINLYQALQAILLPSANNMADTVAIWAYGSLANYADAANAYLAKHNINHTHIGSDASGMSPTTTSTPSDLVKIGELAMQNPVLAEIVKQSEASGIPVEGTIHSTNPLLGQYNIIGIKTGNTDEAGGVFLSASTIKMNNTPITIVTAVMGAVTRGVAFIESAALIKSAQANFHTVEFTKAGDVVGKYSLPWGGSVNIVASKDLSLQVWNGSRATAVLKLDDIAADSTAGTQVGTLSVGKSATNNLPPVPVKLETTPAQPSVVWRLTHPF